MAKIDAVIKKETAYVALWVLAACMMTQGVCLVVGWWSVPVLLGSLLGGATAVGNFLLMCLTVQNALNRDKKKAAQFIQASSGGRLMLQGLMMVLAGVLPIFNLWTALIPLIVPTLAVRVRHWSLAKQNPSPDRPAIGWDDEEDEED